MTKTVICLMLALAIVSAKCPFHAIFGGATNEEFEEKVKEQEDALYVGAAQSTLDSYWLKITGSKYYTLPDVNKMGLTGPVSLSQFTFTDMNVPMDRTQDTMPSGRTKWVHPTGVCGKVKFIANDYAKAKYSGMFRGGDFGIARLSVAGPISTLGFTPGMAIKFFRENNKPSGNVISMYSLSGQGKNTNFFQNSFSNMIDEPNFGQWLAALVTFRRASKCPTVLSLKDFADFDQNGIPEVARFPKQIVFKPVAETQINSNSYNDFRNDLSMVIKKGARLYTVYAAEYKDGPQMMIGTLQAESEFVASDFCDNQVFFKHQRGEVTGC